ncbi:class I SAM-dependent methyltransferase [Thalassotalea sp. PS06]|uniref:class I SAM-dependent methyltransferase n=1 Tax=Thalassotalea sp. PS06 TaxID=2594005 RepID=UPI0011642F28|nr:class I SAM-dependent methyltransferase [Thalassotalea sp. PS06]QDP01341.1 methyltransferase domain-containing protein [Thalassotalea sp. PS06]
MDNDQSYMQDFMKVFSTLERWGPGKEEESMLALAHLAKTPEKILEIGCGKGLTTIALANATDAMIVASDNETGALQSLDSMLQQTGLKHRVETVCASMKELPFPEESFDTIWAEGCAYIMGFTNALSAWKKFLTPSGVLVVSDLVWFSDDPGTTSKSFFSGEYPDMTTLENRLEQIKSSGYRVRHHYSLSEQAWKNYYQPLKERALQLQSSMPDSRAISDILNEVSLYEHYLGDFGYQVFVLEKH